MKASFETHTRILKGNFFHDGFLGDKQKKLIGKWKKSRIDSVVDVMFSHLEVRIPSEITNSHISAYFLPFNVQICPAADKFQDGVFFHHMGDHKSISLKVLEEYKEANVERYSAELLDYCKELFTKLAKEIG